MLTTLNIGLNTPHGEALEVHQVLLALYSTLGAGDKDTRITALQLKPAVNHGNGTEDTLLVTVYTLGLPMLKARLQVKALSDALQQDCIAVHWHITTHSELLGSNVAKYGTFDPQWFYFPVDANALSVVAKAKLFFTKHLKALTK
jgi:hypothetical protein